jgi:hypothetical protein
MAVDHIIINAPSCSSFKIAKGIYRSRNPAVDVPTGSQHRP